MGHFTLRASVVAVLAIGASLAPGSLSTRGSVRPPVVIVGGSIVELKADAGRAIVQVDTGSGTAARTSSSGPLRRERSSRCSTAGAAPSPFLSNPSTESRWRKTARRTCIPAAATSSSRTWSPRRSPRAAARASPPNTPTGRAPGAPSSPTPGARRPARLRRPQEMPRRDKRHSTDSACPPGTADSTIVSDQIRLALPTRRAIARADHELSLLAVGGGRVIIAQQTGPIIVLAPRPTSAGLVAHAGFRAERLIATYAVRTARSPGSRHRRPDARASPPRRTRHHPTPRDDRYTEDPSAPTRYLLRPRSPSRMQRLGPLSGFHPAAHRPRRQHRRIHTRPRRLPTEPHHGSQRQLREPDRRPRQRAARTRRPLHLGRQQTQLHTTCRSRETTHTLISTARPGLAQASHLSTTAGTSSQPRRAWPTMPPTNVATPARRHGSGFKCSSQPLAVAVCQHVVPGPARCAQATKSRRTPAPVSRPNAERRAVGFDAISPPATATGARTTRPSDTKPSAATHPRSAHAQNQRPAA